MKTLSQNELLVYFIDLLEISGWNWTTTFQLKKGSACWWILRRSSDVAGFHFYGRGTTFQKKCLKPMPFNVIPLLHMLAPWPGLQNELQAKKISHFNLNPVCLQHLKIHQPESDEAQPLNLNTVRQEKSYTRSPERPGAADRPVQWDPQTLGMVLLLHVQHQPELKWRQPERQRRSPVGNKGAKEQKTIRHLKEPAGWKMRQSQEIEL